MARSAPPLALALALALALPRALAAAPAPLGFAAAARDKQLRVLAFGDSMTEGWIQTAWKKTPYTANLEANLRKKLEPRGVSVQMTNGGVGGKGVLDALNDAWHARLGEARAAGRPYHYAVFMAGINDILKQHRNAEDIHARMVEMWSAAAKDGTTVIVIPTLPTSYNEGEPTRTELARRMRETVAAANKAGDASLVLLDLERPFDIRRMGPGQRARVFDDGLHLTEYGYTQYLEGFVLRALAKEMGL